MALAAFGPFASALLPVLGPLRAPLLQRASHSISELNVADTSGAGPLLLLADTGNPVSDLFASPVAIAYLGVLTVLFGFLSFLAYSDSQGKQRRETQTAQRDAAMAEMERVVPELRDQGKDEEADAIERELGMMRRAVAQFERPGSKDAAPKKGMRLPWQPAPYEPKDSNRFMRRQGMAEEAVGAPPPEVAKKGRRRPGARNSGAAARRARTRP